MELLKNKPDLLEQGIGRIHQLRTESRMKGVLTVFLALLAVLLMSVITAKSAYAAASLMMKKPCSRCCPHMLITAVVFYRLY